MKQLHRNRDSKIHVLCFTSELGGGGAEMHLTRLLNHFDLSQFQVSVALVRRGGSYESILSKDVDVHYLQESTSGSSALQMLKSLRPLRRVIKEEQPDIICSVMTYPNMIALLSTRLGLRSKPKPRIVCCVQTPLTFESQNFRRGIRTVFLSMVSRFYSKADVIVGLSAGVARELKILTKKPGLKIRVIPNIGLGNQILEGAQQALPQKHSPPGGPLVVACGRLIELKGFSNLIEAIARVCAVMPVSLWIVGEGEQRHTLEQQIKRLGLTDCVHLLGFQSNPYHYMAAADVFVLSSFHEGFGNVIVEAMACGTPVVATDCPYGPAEIITSEENGLLVPLNDIEAMAQAIERVLTDKQLKQKLSRNGKLRAQDFSARLITDAYSELFQEIVTNSEAVKPASEQNEAAQ